MGIPIDKFRIVNELKQKLHTQIAKAQDELNQLTEARNEEQKSSVGDKYETGRSMAQMEMKKVSDQLDKYQSQLQALQQIKIDQYSDVVKYGSLIISSQGIYFISIGIGLLNVERQKVFCISMASPIGTLLMGKKAGSTVDFRGRKIHIEKVL